MPNALRDLAALIPSPGPEAATRFRTALDRHLRRFDGQTADRRMGLAVSGGPDSLALLLLAHAASPGQVEAATVDHGLRPESADEAAMVAAVCARLGVRHAICRGGWNPDAPEGLQAAARAYRYRELAAWCGARGLRFMLTAHHADDQAETLLMRLARGAGVAGLGGVRSSRRLDEGVTLLRPLLGFTKAELVAIVSAAGLRAVNDPSNTSERFDRTRARRLLAETDWLDPARLVATAQHLAEAETALEWAASREYARRVGREESDDTALAGGTWLLDPRGLPDELLRRIVLLLLAEMEIYVQRRSAAPPPRGPDLARFIDRLAAGESATLRHVLARPGSVWRFTLAPPRRS